MFVKNFAEISKNKVGPTLGQFGHIQWLPDYAKVYILDATGFYFPVRLNLDNQPARINFVVLMEFSYLRYIGSFADFNLGRYDVPLLSDDPGVPIEHIVDDAPFA